MSTESRPRGSTTQRNSASRSPDLQVEKVNQLFGEFKGLRAQFTEFRKQVLSAADCKAIKEELKQIRNDMALARQNTAIVQQCQQAVEQQGALQQQLRQQLESIAPAARNATVLQQELNRMQGQVDPLAHQLRSLQQEQAQGLQRMREEQAAIRRQSEDAAKHFQNLSQEQAAIRRQSEDAAKRFQSLSQDIAQKMQSLDRVAQKVQSMETSQGQAAEAKREVDRMRQEHTSMKQRSEEALSKVQAMQQQTNESKRLMDQMRQEVTQMKNENQGARGHEKEREAHMRRLEEKTRGLDMLGRLQVTADTTCNEFFALKKKLYDAGVLAPPKEPEPEKTPVGTLELGEDVFTARLLIRLGLMKAQGEQEVKARELQGPDGFEEMASEDSSEEASLRPTKMGLVDDFEENVTGLQVPEIEPEGRGLLLVTVGWVTICMVTLGVQVLIVGIMLMYGVEAGGDCIDEPLPPGKWYMLHISKAFATLAAGMLMGKELMDIVNYWMVSELLLTQTSKEVVVSAVLRILLILFIATANVIIFMTMNSPADVWINMTALGFISELSSAVLEIGKRGVFGHHIGKAVTSVNYSLNFMTDYPWWFDYARGITLTIAFAFIIVFALILYIVPDNVCMANGKSQTSNLLDRFWQMF